MQDGFRTNETVRRIEQPLPSAQPESIYAMTFADKAAARAPPPLVIAYLTRCTHAGGVGRQTRPCMPRRVSKHPESLGPSLSDSTQPGGSVIVSTPGVPSDDLLPSLLSTSDVLGAGWFAADAANVKPGSTVVIAMSGRDAVEARARVRRHRHRERAPRRGGVPDHGA